jgi:hypothetical protein
MVQRKQFIAQTIVIFCLSYQTSQLYNFLFIYIPILRLLSDDRDSKNVFPSIFYLVFFLISFAECQFGKTIKELGSTWFADLGPPFGVMYCIKCECGPVSIYLYKMIEVLIGISNKNR